TLIAIPIIYSVYVGIAEAARDLTIQNAQKRRDDDHACYLVGGLENDLTNAKLVLQQMIAIAASQSPSIETTNQIMMGRTLITQSVLKVVDAAMEITGGLAFHRPYGLEKLFRDAQGARYHPMREEVQRKLAGQLALGNAQEIL
ncbi:acyl-CoA dehydrogenase family protein, partial [Acaryochloris sp. IP29b_bin.137]|uniref:acyl-CoA dehydrogenase family protein n=1 Tax=Acaryochloris sp. IP29b_bin.137 TaxID=2969217 RepID=UPI00260AB651